MVNAWLGTWMATVLSLLTTLSPVAPFQIGHVSSNFRCYSLRLSAWSVTDDWSSLSKESPKNAVPDSRSIFNVDLAAEAALAMGEITNDDFDSSEENWRNDVVKEIYSSSYSSNTDDPPLYDTFTPPSQSMEDQMGREIALLVRCNERPEDMLIAGGRALPPLTDEDKTNPMQLVHRLPDGSFEATDFFKEAISRIYNDHATLSGTDQEQQNHLILDATGVASWLSKCLDQTVGKHDRRVLVTLARFGAYGQGYLTESNFQNLYLKAVTGDVTQRQLRSDPSLKHRDEAIQSVWRDLRKHGLVSPAEATRHRQEEELRDRLGHSIESDAILSGATAGEWLDECEILDWDDQTDGSTTRRHSSSIDAGRSSHESVVLGSDGKTPLWIRDGDFVFIDEESCIGCTQCASVAPTSFLMLDSGRARTISQRNAPDVPQAIAACPVNCMHRVSFDELRELEQARDHGDGRTDHRHMGAGIGHTPLNVAGMSSDANHKSSWYHYLRNKCFMSNQCPKRGCFDCPYYDSPGQNPRWKERHKEAEHVRAQSFTDMGFADAFRNTADL